MALARAVPTDLEIDGELPAYYPALVRRLALVLRSESDAQDIGQAAFLRAYEQRHTFVRGDLRAWFYTIGLRLAFNELRHRQVVASRTIGDEPTWAMSSEPESLARVS
jgi:DNA-directed RNA polymerase specialized sigma24 family protein